MGLAQSQVSDLTGLRAIGCVSLQGAFPIYQGLSQNLARDGRVACGTSGKESTWPMQETETQFRSLSWENPLEEDTATYSSILAWRIPWTEEPGGCGP